MSILVTLHGTNDDGVVVARYQHRMYMFETHQEEDEVLTDIVHHLNQLGLHWWVQDIEFVADEYTFKEYP